jgi:hypothetical protein
MRRATMSRSTAAVAAVGCAALCVTGCSGDRDTGEGRKIEAVVKRFSLSGGPEACSLLTPKAVTTVYGRGTQDASVARARCVSASKRFSGQAISVTFVNIKDSTTARATAKTADGRRYFAVSLQKRRGRWLIDAVTPTQRPG